jgi:hypothetical protein
MPSLSSYPDDLKNIKMWYTIEETLDFNGQVMLAPTSIIAIAQLYTDSVEIEQQGDGVADGTDVVTLTIDDEAVFICTKLTGSTNVSAILVLGTGALATPPTTVDFIDLQAVGSLTLMAEVNAPIFVINNIGGSGDLVLRMYAPQTAMGVGTNNDTNHYFNGYIGGILLT